MEQHVSTSHPSPPPFFLPNHLSFSIPPSPTLQAPAVHCTTLPFLYHIQLPLSDSLSSCDTTTTRSNKAKHDEAACRLYTATAGEACRGEAVPQEQQEPQLVLQELPLVSLLLLGPPSELRVPRALRLSDGRAGYPGRAGCPGLKRKGWGTRRRAACGGKRKRKKRKTKKKRDTGKNYCGSGGVEPIRPFQKRICIIIVYTSLK